MVQMSYVSEAFLRTKALPPVCPIRNGYAANPFNSSEIIVCLNFNVTAIYHCPTGYSFNGTKCVLRNPTHFDGTHLRHRRDVSDESDDNISFSCADKKDGF